jgi:hypothetical protein
MEVYILIEEEYKNSSWCQSILNGLNNEKRRKKVKLKHLKSLELLPLKFEDSNNSILLIGAKPAWIKENIIKAQSLNYKPILINNTQFNHNYPSCSIVSSDVLGAITDAFSLFKENNKKRIALYGVNPNSTADVVRKNSFILVGGKEKDIYYNNGLLEKCFLEFLPNFQKYDGVLCVNDFTAISLINRLKKENMLKKLPAIISLSSSTLGAQFSPSITSFSNNYEKFGAAALSIIDTISKNEYISSVNSLIKYDFSNRETTKDFKNFPVNKQVILPQVDNEINIYTDSELNEIMSVETFLKTADELDYIIIKMYKNNISVEKISEKTYLSISTIKYRKKNLCNIFNAKKITDVFDILTKYILIN